MWCWFFGHRWQTILEQPPDQYYTFCERCLTPYRFNAPTTRRI